MALVTKKWMLPVCRRCCSGSINVRVAPAHIYHEGKENSHNNQEIERECLQNSQGLSKT